MQLARETSSGAPPGWQPPSVTDIPGGHPKGWVVLDVYSDADADTVVTTVNAAYNGPPNRKGVVETAAHVLWWADAYQESFDDGTEPQWCGCLWEASAVSVREIVKDFEKAMRARFGQHNCENMFPEELFCNVVTGQIRIECGS